MLAGQGYKSVSLRPAASPFSLEGMFPSQFRIKPIEVARFSRQMATLLDAGISLLPALQLMAQQRTQSPQFRRIMMQMCSSLSTGMSFSYAMSQHDKVFSEIYLKTIGVGERTGQLQLVLRDQAEYVEKQLAFKKSISGALTYPAIVSVAGLAVVTLMVTFVMPKMANMLSAFGSKPPFPTMVLMGLSDFFAAYKLFLLVGIVVTVVFLVVALRYPAGRRVKERIFLKLPVLGAPAYMTELARITRTMAMMVKAGLPLQEVVEILPRTCTNSLFREALEQVRTGLLLGQGLSYPMAAQPVFPPLMIQMVRIGEDTNNLDSSLKVLADFYETTAQDMASAMVAIVTPLSTIVLAVLVGFIALAVMLPMYSAAGSMQ